MKAVFCKQLGGPENLAIGESDPPIPGPNDVHIRVRAAGLNFADTLQIAGKYQSKLKPPFVPGMEVAGEIIGLGSEVTRPLRIGQRVMAFMRGGGAFAEEALVDSEWLVPIPDEMDDIIAAGFPTVYGTSNFALKHRGQLKKGETLLVLGAAGGVGLTAVELGKQMGARVIAAAGGTEKCNVTIDHGADFAIDYKSESIKERVREITGGIGADVVYDAVGGDVFDQAIRAVNWEARMLIIGFASGRIQQVPANLILVKNISVVGVVYGAQTERDPAYGASFVQEAADFFRQGKLKPHTGKVFPLEDATGAMNALLSRDYAGKIILVP
ncbi:NADPH:quinone oxidoreductase family protein [Rhodospirillaceae bacterium]|jgi:NADPH:quinone reductase|nr:NADPH:quinone oxidoreductase family protein [Rhodospirillaceae bacterium]MDC1442468.1 NADPH:quinone oxidoreductase family protein [Rhodospirillaceae bacterium]